MRATWIISWLLLLLSASVSEKDLLLMRLIDEEYTRHPFYGSRRFIYRRSRRHRESGGCVIGLDVMEKNEIDPAGAEHPRRYEQCCGGKCERGVTETNPEFKRRSVHTVDKPGKLFGKSFILKY